MANDGALPLTLNYTCSKSGMTWLIFIKFGMDIVPMMLSL
jgi:hypothetical protein